MTADDGKIDDPQGDGLIDDPLARPKVQPAPICQIRGGYLTCTHHAVYWDKTHGEMCPFCELDRRRELLELQLKLFSLGVVDFKALGNDEETLRQIDEVERAEFQKSVEAFLDAEIPRLLALVEADPEPKTLAGRG